MANRLTLIICSLAISFLLGCRGQSSKKPPIHLNPNMDRQEKFKPYDDNSFYGDKRNMRPLPEGVVAMGHLKEDEAFYKGVVNGDYVNNPVKLTSEFMTKGQEKFNTFCTPCHGMAGLGNGIVVKKGFVLPPSLIDPRILGLKDGEIFSVISEGVRNMPSYGLQIQPKERWAIVAYIRALQKSQTASLQDIPADKHGEIIR